MDFFSSSSSSFAFPPPTFGCKDDLSMWRRQRRNTSYSYYYSSSSFSFSTSLTFQTTWVMCYNVLLYVIKICLRAESNSRYLGLCTSTLTSSATNDTLALQQILSLHWNTVVWGVNSMKPVALLSASSASTGTPSIPLLANQDLCAHALQMIPWCHTSWPVPSGHVMLGCRCGWLLQWWVWPSGINSPADQWPPRLWSCDWFMKVPESWLADRFTNSRFYSTQLVKPVNANASLLDLNIYYNLSRKTDSRPIWFLPVGFFRSC